MDFSHRDRETRAGERDLEDIGTRYDFRKDARVINVDSVFCDSFILSVNDDLIAIREAPSDDELVAIRCVLPCDLRYGAGRHEGQVRESIRLPLTVAIASTKSAYPWTRE